MTGCMPHNNKHLGQMAWCLEKGQIIWCCPPAWNAYYQQEVLAETRNQRLVKSV